MFSQQKVEKASAYPILKFRTFNIGCLPDKLEFINRGEFNNKNNLQRAQGIAEELLAGDYDLICIQEAWDSEVVGLLKALLIQKYPTIIHEDFVTLPNLLFYRYLKGLDKDVYQHETFKEKIEITYNPSGLLFFSKLKKLEEIKHVFDHKLFGEETFGKKEYRAVKFAVGQDGFITYIGTHFPAGGGILAADQEKVFGTTSYIRGQAAHQIYVDVIKSNWHTTPPVGTQLKPLATLLGGDMNDTYDNCREWYRISIGGSAVNGFDKGDIKYSQALALAQSFDFVSPNNWMEIRNDSPLQRGAGKQIDPYKEEEAKLENKMTGTDLGSNPPVRNIDVLTIARNKNNPNGKLITTIVSSNGNSDHNALDGVLDLNSPRIDRKNIYDSYTIYATGKQDPSCGWLNRILGAPTIFAVKAPDDQTVKRKSEKKSNGCFFCFKTPAEESSEGAISIESALKK